MSSTGVFKAQLAHIRQGLACLVSHNSNRICSDKMASQPFKKMLLNSSNEAVGWDSTRLPKVHSPNTTDGVTGRGRAKQNQQTNGQQISPLTSLRCPQPSGLFW